MHLYVIIMPIHALIFHIAHIKLPGDRYLACSIKCTNDKAKAIGRGYYTEDAPMIASLGGASGYIAVMIFALYVNSSEVLQLYQRPDVLWLACPILLYWISRVWLLAHRGSMHDDPSVFAVKDKQSLLTCLCIFAVFVVATL